jgi:hypothetical protein
MSRVWRREEVRDVAASSLAGRLWADFPDAEEIVVHVQVYELPTLRRYRNGDRPRWLTIYEAAFARAAETPNDIEEDES